MAICQAPIFGIDPRLVRVAALFVAGFNVWIWFGAFAGHSGEDALYFLDVGQGDGQLITLDRGRGAPPLTILIDGGRDRRVLDALAKGFGGSAPKRIDVVVMTHSDIDHFGGLIDIVRRLDVGLFVSNGRVSDEPAFAELQNALRERGVEAIALKEGDRIRYGPAVVSILSPSKISGSKESGNEESIVALLEKGGSRALLTGDIGFATEDALMERGYDVSADILKVGHHGSKHSTGERFAVAVRPAISVIGVGANRYGHPAPRVLETLELAGSRIHRTDTDGTLKILLDK